MQSGKLFAAIALSVAGISCADAATVNAEHGDVHVNPGNGFAKLGAGASPQLGAGSRVMVGPGGVATINYAGSCSVRVPSGMWSVQSKAPCPEGVAMLDFTNRMNQSAPPPGGFDSTTAVIVGGLLVAGGAGAIILLQDDKTDKPFSP